MRTFLPVWVGVASAILSVVWLFIERVMGISFVGPILDSIILMLAKLFFKSNEAGVVFASSPALLFYCRWPGGWPVLQVAIVRKHSNKIT